MWNKFLFILDLKVSNSNEIFRNISKIYLKTIKYCLNYKQKSLNKLDTHEKSSNKQHSTSK